MAELETVKANWDALGRLDPFYEVLNKPGMKGGRWDKAEFFRTGADEIAAVMSQLGELGIRIDKQRALDFGCGVGRLSQALATHFQSVTGVDIAPSMVAKARDLNPHGSRCTFQVLESWDLSTFESQSFDFVYSVLVLQHMPSQFAAGYIAEFFRIVKPGGTVVFQIPEWIAPPGLRVRVRQALPPVLLSTYRRLRYGASAEISTEYNAMSQGTVEQLVREHGGKLHHVDGRTAMPLRYWVTKV